MEAALARPLGFPPHLRPLATTRPAALLLLPSSSGPSLASVLNSRFLLTLLLHIYFCQRIVKYKLNNFAVRNNTRDVRR